MLASGAVYLGIYFLAYQRSGLRPEILELFGERLPTEVFSLDPFAFVIGLCVVLAPGYLLVASGNIINSRFLQGTRTPADK